MHLPLCEKVLTGGAIAATPHISSSSSSDNRVEEQGSQAGQSPTPCQALLECCNCLTHPSGRGLCVRCFNGGGRCRCRCTGEHELSNTVAQFRFRGRLGECFAC